MININMFGGPGTGKSTMASGLFYRLKTNGEQVEYIQEFAKELTFSKDHTRLKDQVLILGEQHHRMFRLDSQVDYVIHDSPFIMGLAYLSEDSGIPIKEFEDFIVALWKSKNHINIFLERDVAEHEYQEYGRNQTLSEAIDKDVEIKELLLKHNIDFRVIKIGKNTIEDIEKLIKLENEIRDFVSGFNTE